MPRLVSIVIITYIRGSRQHNASNNGSNLSTMHISINIVVVVLGYGDISFFLRKQQNSITPTRTLNNTIVHPNIREVLRAIDPIDNPFILDPRKKERTREKKLRNSEPSTVVSTLAAYMCKEQPSSLIVEYYRATRAMRPHLYRSSFSSSAFTLSPKST